MKILLIQPSNAVAGAEISALQVIEGLSQKYNVSCHVAFPPPDNSMYASMLRKTTIGIITIPLFTWHKAKSVSLITDIRLLMYKIYKTRPAYSIWKLLKYIQTHKIDLIYSNSGLCPIGGIVARIAGIAHVWHIREKLGSNSEFPLLLGDDLSKKFFKKWSDFILCNSKFSASFFISRIEKLQVILNGIETNKFHNQSAVDNGNKLRIQLGVNSQDLVIGMVGSIFSSWKEHEVFLQMARKLKDHQVEASYVIFGGSTEFTHSKYALAVFQKSLDLGMEKDVIFVGLQSDIPAMMNSIDIMTHPTAQEGSGRIIMEAMAAGKPVVGVNAGGVGELIRNGENGLSVPVKRPDLLADAALTLIQNPQLRLRIGQKAMIYAQQHFELERTLTEIYEIFERVLGNNN